jgi:hypothetical protein
MTDDAATPRSRLLKPVLVLVSVLAGLALLPAGLAGMMSPMMADSGTSPAVIAFIIIMMSLPLALIILPVLAWISYLRRRDRMAWLFMALLLIWPAGLFVVSMALDSGT